MFSRKELLYWDHIDLILVKTQTHQALHLLTFRHSSLPYLYHHQLNLMYFHEQAKVLSVTLINLTILVPRHLAWAALYEL